MAVRDILFIMVFIFALGLAFFVIKFSTDTAINKMISIPAINQSEAAVEALDNTMLVSNRADKLLLGAFIGLVLGLIITGWFIGGYPIFMAAYFIIVVIAVAISPFLSNAWESISVMPIFGGTLAAYPITNHLLLNLPVYIAIIGFIGLIVMFGKPYIVNESGR